MKGGMKIINIAVLSCKNIKDETCFGCHRCLMGFDKKEGESLKDTRIKMPNSEAYYIAVDVPAHLRHFGWST